MAKDKDYVYLLVPQREGDGFTTRLKRAVVRRGPVGRDDLIEIAKLLRERD